MQKPKLSAKEVLQDLRAGMDDSALMKKYKLSGKGLQSLFRKLGQAGIIRNLNAHAVMADLKSGISSDDLMDKYGLTPQGMQSLFQELDRAGLLKASAEDEESQDKITININKIVEDIRAGMSRPQLMMKYKLSPRALRWVSMTLISSGMIPWQQVYDQLCTSYDELVPDKLRRAKRYPLPFDRDVYEEHIPESAGKIRDISENGMGIIGIKGRVGYTKTLVVPEDEFGEFASFMFDAECRWITKDPKGMYVAGFEISRISIGNLKEFQLMFHLVQFVNRDRAFL